RALRFKEFTKQHDVMLGRQAFAINYGNLRSAFRTPTDEFFTAAQQQFQHLPPTLKPPHLVGFGETLHTREFCKDLESRIRVGDRSEERRVGKECRSGWWRYA